jgi:hypothetical protein
MRYYAIGFVLVSFPGFVFCACGNESTTTTTTTSGSGGAGGWDCHDVILYSDPCDACLADKCCDDLSACSASPQCIFCTTQDELAELCTKEPQRSLSTAIHACGWGQCREECAQYGRSLGPDPNDPVTKFCSTSGPPFCEALFACCADQHTLDWFGSTLEGCKAKMGGPHCLREFSSYHIDDSYGFDDRPVDPYYGLRRRIKDGQVILDQAQLDACVAGLTAMTAGGAACIANVQEFFGVQCITAFKGQLALGDACIWHAGTFSGFKYAFIPCKEGRCEEDKCIPFHKVGDICDPIWGKDGPGACDYLHSEACYVQLDMNTWACGPQKETGETCNSPRPRAECKSGSCEANLCAPATQMSICDDWY